jgi:GAF domain-containing protein
VNSPLESRRRALETRPEISRERELAVAREIAESFLTASSPVEVYRRALARVTPLVGADFAAVFLRDPDDPRLLRLACAHKWPQSSARFLGDLRVREGRGPTGQAVSRARAVEVPDVFAEDSFEAWGEPARELGFTSVTSHPLAVDGRVLGALSFYYRGRQHFDDRDRVLLTVVAHQLASIAERARGSGRLRDGGPRLDQETEAILRKIEGAGDALDRVEANGKGRRPGSGPDRA